MKIAVLGAGGWGTALAAMWHACGRPVALWTPFAAEQEALARDRENKRFLPGVPLPEGLAVSTDLAGAVSGAPLVVFAVPSQFLRAVAEQTAPHLASGATAVSVAKGLEKQADGFPLRMSQVLEQALGSRAVVAALSGPSHAEEVSRQLPTAVVVAGENGPLVRDTCSTPWFRIYSSDDLPGVELGGALKNPIAIAAGIGAGLGGGDNALGALVTRGMYEIARLGAVAGAQERTFAGLSGIGDLVTTCVSRHSRNRRVGFEVARGKKLEVVLKEMGMVAEGVETARTVDQWAAAHSVETPITSAVVRVLFHGSDAKEELGRLMGRSLKDEF